MDVTEATRISDFVRDSLLKAANAGKEVSIEFERGMKSISPEGATRSTVSPSGELDLRLHIPADDL